MPRCLKRCGNTMAPSSRGAFLLPASVLYAAGVFIETQFMRWGGCAGCIASYRSPSYFIMNGPYLHDENGRGVVDAVFDCTKIVLMTILLRFVFFKKYFLCSLYIFFTHPMFSLNTRVSLGITRHLILMFLLYVSE